MSKQSRHDPHDGRKKARRRALQALYQWSMTDQAASEIAQQFAEEQDMRTVDVAYFEELLSGTIDERERIDELLVGQMDRGIDRVDPTELVILRLAGYELLKRPDVPFQVVLDQAIELARQFGSDQTAGYVNGVLDQCAAQARAIEYQAAAES